MEHRVAKTEELLNHIVSRQAIAKKCRQEETELASQRNSAECDAGNSIIALAKELKEVLGPQHATRLADELVRVTGWQPPRAVKE